MLMRMHWELLLAQARYCESVQRAASARGQVKTPVRCTTGYARSIHWDLPKFLLEGF